MKVMINFIDSRMSNLTYTLGVSSNIISEISSGFAQELKFIDANSATVTFANPSAAAIAAISQTTTSPTAPNISVYQTLNYLYIIGVDYYLIGFYGMKLIAGFLNFKSPNVSADLAAD